MRLIPILAIAMLAAACGRPSSEVYSRRPLLVKSEAGPGLRPGGSAARVFDRHTPRDHFQRRKRQAPTVRHVVVRRHRERPFGRLGNPLRHGRDGRWCSARRPGYRRAPPQRSRRAHERQARDCSDHSQAAWPHRPGRGPRAGAFDKQGEHRQVGPVRRRHGSGHGVHRRGVASTRDQVQTGSAFGPRSSRCFAFSGALGHGLCRDRNFETPEQLQIGVAAPAHGCRAAVERAATRARHKVRCVGRNAGRQRWRRLGMRRPVLGLRAHDRRHAVRQGAAGFGSASRGHDAAFI